MGNRTQIEQVLYDCFVGSDLNQKEIAKRVGIHDSHISMFMSGKRSFSVVSLDALCTFFNLQLARKDSL
jgi:transcriptional regulator with XRE-family HTH domain